MTTETLSWMQEASCKGKTELFFFAPEESAAVRRKREYTAKAICRQCSVMLACREYARNNGELGVWGGETEEERYSSGHLNNVAVNRLYKRSKTILKVDKTVVEVNIIENSTN